MKLALIGSFDVMLDDISKYISQTISQTIPQTISQTNLRHIVLGGEEGIKAAAEIWSIKNDVPIVCIIPNYLTDEKDAEQIARNKLASHADEVIYISTGNGGCDLEYVKAVCEKKNKPLTVYNLADGDLVKT